eukprot:TRINITY_DN52433_c0_g1_i1.p1 TRINITY_DN52433_c0_g1~~TRINITY_DN52433_c0_g1_i1.p1  ORF type:complete len:515 (-),score=142.22 TRINITY_DN52433_c0_g1_i1:101-1453(-)
MAAEAEPQAEEAEVSAAVAEEIAAAAELAAVAQEAGVTIEPVSPIARATAAVAGAADGVSTAEVSTAPTSWAAIVVEVEASEEEVPADIDEPATAVVTEAVHATGAATATEVALTATVAAEVVTAAVQETVEVKEEPSTATVVVEETATTECAQLPTKVVPTVEVPSTVPTPDTALVTAPIHEADTKPKAKPKAKRSQRRSGMMAMEVPLFAIGNPEVPQETAPSQTESLDKQKDVPAPSSSSSSASTCPSLLAVPAPSPPSHDVESFMSPRKTRECRSPTKGLEPYQILRTVPLSPPRPEDNYELSDQADSDADETQEALRRAQKHVPRWCSNYLELLSKQADWDADTIFGKGVAKVELDEIFTDDLYEAVGRSRPKRARGSSGNWRKDALTNDECDRYRKKMGQTKAWTADVQNMPIGAKGNHPDLFAGLALGGRPLPTPARASISKA